MKYFLFSFLTLWFVFSAPAKDDKFHICFFELDNTRTSQNFKNRIKNNNQRTDLCKKRQEFSSTNTVVHCYQPQIGKNERGAPAFKRMIQEVLKAGDRCDGLVMSGHHTGNWYGKTGGIKLKDMEDLSCDPKYRDWFSNIKALWLDGCNTVTDNILKSDRSNIPTPDSETARVVGKEYSAEEMDRGAVAGTSQAYTASLDKNTPLSSRYLRMFPHTQLYGFNGAAPEGKDKGEWVSFIADHLSLVGRALQAEQSQTEQIKKKDQIKQALSAILSVDPCDEEKIEAWEKASWDGIKTESIEQQDYSTAYKLGCYLTLAKQVLDDPYSQENQKALAQYIKNLEGDKSLANKKELLELANEILNKPNPDKAVQLAKKTLLNTLDEITNQDTGLKEEDKTYTHLLFNNIYDTWKTAQKYKTKDNAFYKQAQRKLQADNFKVSLRERIKSNQTASLRKGDYIQFYMEVNGLSLSKAPGFISNGINSLIEKAEKVFPDLKSPRQSNIPVESRRALAVSVVDQLFQYGLLTEKQIISLVSNKNLFPKSNKNAFITEVQLNLAISSETQEKRLRTAWTKGEIKSIRAPVLRSLSKKYLQNPSQNLTALQEVSDSMDLNKNSEVMTFFNVLHSRFNRYTQKQREDFVIEYSQKSNKNLEELLLWYAATNFEPKRNQEICGRLKDKPVDPTNLSYVCSSG